MTRIRLEYIGPESLPSLELDDGIATLGRSPQCTVPISRREISSLHATIIIQQAAIRVIDNNSTNGTFVNGERVSICSVNDADIIHFAGLPFRVRIGTAALPNVTETQSIPAPDVTAALEVLRFLKEPPPVHFQPIVSLDSAQVFGFEVLGRGRGAIGVEALLNSAIRIGCLGDLTRSFIDSARFCVTCGSCWTRPKHLFVNAHVDELRDSNSLSQLFKSLDALAGQASITLEIPETYVAEGSKMHVLLKEVRARGFSVAYDDFGRGQSRLVDLISNPPDYVKFDRSLIDHVGARGSGAARKVLSAMHGVCLDLGVLCIAEGLEREEDSQFCRDIGIPLAQGFLVGKPAPMLDQLRRRNGCIY